MKQNIKGLLSRFGLRLLRKQRLACCTALFRKIPQ